MNSFIYLDHLRSAPRTKVMDAFTICSRQKWAHPGSLHENGQPLFSELQSIKRKIKKQLFASDQTQILLTSGRCHAFQMFMQGMYAHWIRETGKTHVHIPEYDNQFFSKTVNGWEKLGLIQKPLPINSQGQINCEQLIEALKPRSGVLALSWASGLTGIIQPLQDIAEICKEKEVKLFVEASCVVGKLFFQLEELNADALSLDGSLFQGLVGNGALFIPKLSSWFESLENDLNFSFAHWKSFEISIEEANQHFETEHLETARLRDRFESLVLSSIADTQVLFQGSERLPNTSIISFLGVKNELLLYHLARKGIYASIGGGEDPRLSDLLLACGMDSWTAHGALSFNFSLDITPKEIEGVVDALANIVKQLRLYSVQLRS